MIYWLIFSMVEKYIVFKYQRPLWVISGHTDSPRHVRFTPNNGRWAAHPSQHLAVRFMSTRPSCSATPREGYWLIWFATSQRPIGPIHLACRQ
jgi:hypothetical protein